MIGKYQKHKYRTRQKIYDYIFLSYIFKRICNK